MSVYIQEILDKAILCASNGDVYKAEMLYICALENDSYNDTALKNLGLIFIQTNRNDEAIITFKKYLEFNPDEVEIYNFIGLAYHRKSDANNAKIYFEKSLNINPKNSNTYNYLGNVYKDAKLPENAVIFHKNALILEPDNPEFYFNLGVDYKLLQRYDESLECFLTANKLGLDNPEINYHIASIYELKTDIDNAIKYYEKIISQDSSFTEAYLKLSQLYIVKEDFDLGWKYHEQRILNRQKYNETIKNIGKPVWNTDSLAGKTIYLYHEVGLGDSIHFARYFKVLKNSGANVIFKSQTQLVNLLKENNLGAEIISNESLSNVNEENIDAAIPLLSLPYFLGTNLSNIPYPDGYLQANKDKVSLFKAKYFNNKDFKIGICWDGNPDNWYNSLRSVPLANFYKISQITGLKLYSLQKNHGIEQINNISADFNIINLDNEINDFTDTAAIIENLDLVITIDSSMVHLAGALNKPAWLLLSTYPDWRWFINKRDSPWYSSVRIFRQNEIDNWSYVFDKVYNELPCINL